MQNAKCKNAKKTNHRGTEDTELCLIKQAVSSSQHPKGSSVPPCLCGSSSGDIPSLHFEFCSTSAGIISSHSRGGFVRLMVRLSILLAVSVSPAVAQTPPAGQAIFDRQCAACHADASTGAPTRDALRQL